MSSIGETRSKKIILLGILLSLSLILGYVESSLSFIIPIPGYRIGLSQIIVLYVFYRYSIKEAMFLSLTKVFLSSLLFGMLFQPIFLISLGGSLLSLLSLFFAKKLKLHIVTTSILASIFHNIGQMIMVSLIFSKEIVIIYLPYMIPISIIAGIIVGIIVVLILKKLDPYKK